MSSDPPSDARSSEPEPTAGLAERVKARGTELLEALERHAPGARDHADGTAAYAFAAAVELDLDRDHAEAVRETARLHEVGNVYVPAAVVAKPRGELTPEEQELLDSAFASGAELARGAGIPEHVSEWIGAIRERFDGSGPGGLAGERIPIESRIMRVACACDAALAAPTPSATSQDERRRMAVDSLRAAAGSELDPRVTLALTTMLERATAK
ncbi:MAG TPA: HD domain-containing phosphohydrolase [Solirubrobacterales bacterium]|nr:HD domain-containing phosphohydrolase [Solirubrobacterales bacterium]